jgi:hypothetical protein
MKKINHSSIVPWVENKGGAPWRRLPFTFLLSLLQEKRLGTTTVNTKAQNATTARTTRVIA